MGICRIDSRIKMRDGVFTNRLNQNGRLSDMWLLLQLIMRFPFLALHAERGDRGLSFPRPLSRQEEAALFVQMEQGTGEQKKAARDKLIEHNLRLVSHIVSKYARSGCGDDLFSIGCIGLIKAVETFSPEKKIRFSSYAAKCVTNEILMHFRSLKKNSNDVSINDPIETDRDGNPLTLFDLIADETDIAEAVDLKMDSEKLHELVRSTLSPRERMIITLRYGLTGDRPQTQLEVSEKLGISRSYVSRIEKKALERLRMGFE